MGHANFRENLFAGFVGLAQMKPCTKFEVFTFTGRGNIL